MLDRGVQLHHINAGNYLVKNRKRRLIHLFGVSFGTTPAHRRFYFGVTQTFD
jgi:hypothetical protein